MLKTMELLLKKIELLEILVKGCRVHPAYRAIRPATGKCLPCVEMWEARQQLNKLTEQQTDQRKRSSYFVLPRCPCKGGPHGGCPLYVYLLCNGWGFNIGELNTDVLHQAKYFMFTPLSLSPQSFLTAYPASALRRCSCLWAWQGVWWQAKPVIP